MDEPALSLGLPEQESLPETIAVDLSDDQEDAYTRVAELIALSGLTIAGAPTESMGARDDMDDVDLGRVFSVLGKAGSGKTQLLAMLTQALLDADTVQIGPDGEGQRAGKRSFAVVAPTNKAASVLRQRGVAATTLHRIIYTPVYDPEYEKVAEWLREEGKGERPQHDLITEEALDRALEYYKETQSVPAALAMVGVRGSEFINGWARRDDEVDIGLVDEASMLDQKQLDDLRAVFGILICFGDPAQLAPVGESGEMPFDKLPEPSKATLSRVFRQEAGNPIIDLAYALADPELGFSDFEQLVREAAERDERVVIAPRADPELMARSPMLVWRNATRIRLIWAFRTAYGLGETMLSPGEPLICDGAELPARQRKKRIELEQAGLVKGAQTFYLGPGKKPGFARLYVDGVEAPRLSVAAIIQIERQDAEPIIPTAARMGAAFLHGAACTIHKAQGSQWPTVQVFAPDLYAAARANRMEAGLPLWKRLAYVSITRAQNKLCWVTRYAMARPSGELSAEDLK
jgi:exodeoxyribonuclease-5